MLFELIRMFDLKVCRRERLASGHLTERAVPPPRVVPAFDVSKQRQPSLRTGLENLSIEQLTFKTGEETFRHSIVISIATLPRGWPTG